VYGLLAEREGRPVAVDVYPGNTGDPTTVPDQVETLRHRFHRSRVVLVGDRGMLTKTQLNTLREHPGLGWISALRSCEIRDLVDKGTLQLSLFDTQNLAEITSPAFPKERLVACFNPFLAEDRRRTREALLQATERALAKVTKEAARRTKKLLTDDVLGVKVGRVLNRHKMGKHLHYTIAQGRLSVERDEASIKRESALDGLYIIRTSEAAENLSAEDTVRHYKDLARVERAFRSLKGMDLRIRPIFHRTEDHVKAHIFLCLLAYYVEWHLREALAPLLFQDEELPMARSTRDPVAPAEPSDSARAKKRARQTQDGLPLHSFDTLLVALGTRCRNHCRVGAEPNGRTFTVTSEPTDLQRRALELLGLKP
jgi:transposase